MLKVTVSDFIGKGLLQGKKVYLVTKREDLSDEIILETFSKKEAILRADFEAKNIADLCSYRIVITTFVKNGSGYSVEERYINEKTLNRTINSKKFKALKK